MRHLKLYSRGMAVTSKCISVSSAACIVYKLSYNGTAIQKPTFHLSAPIVLARICRQTSLQKLIRPEHA